ncbi:MAG: type II secretion system GspH family protein [Planctomycetaceae bacterium]|nr:type II secretion system GspH family protein [Planctomycetaceae bacterium]
MNLMSRHYADNHVRSRRRGSLMVEMVVCTILLSVVGLILAPAIQSVNRQRKAQKFEILTAIELENLVERLRVQNQDDSFLPSEMSLEDWYHRRFPTATLSVESSTAETGWTSVRLQITQPQNGGHVEQTRSLMCWMSTENAAGERTAGEVSP